MPGPMSTSKFVVTKVSSYKDDISMLDPTISKMSVVSIISLPADVTSCFNLLNRPTHIKIGTENSVREIHLQYF